MENTTAKVSFGFKKTVEKPNLLKNKAESAQKIELIDSIEGSKLKIQGKDPRDEELKKLVIPMTNDQKTRPISKLVESRRIKKEKEENCEKSNGNAESTPMEVDESLEQKAAREIIEDLKNATIKIESKVLELPIHPDELPLNGAVESSIDDYERIPISDFGKAMLRGMGWKEEQQQKDDPQKFDVPMVRPKGLGLGADKVIKKQKLLVQPAPNETLEIKKNAPVKVLAGKHKNLYGTIEGFDDGGGRLIIKLAIGGLKVSMNVIMVQAVPKQEYAKYSKILNSEKYEEFKNDENKTSSAGEKPVKEERRSRSLSPSTSRGRDDNKTSRSRDDKIVSRGRDENRRNKSNERERSKERKRSRERTSNYYKKDKRQYSSDSEDDKTYNRKYNERRRSRSHDKHKRRHSSSDSSNERHRARKKSSKKSSKSKSKKHSSPERYHSSDDERHHKRKYKRSKHHRDRS